jgi:D-arabinan exo alpha-(1,3)/(1,5)-arabinofuranosidase (non-reducing end)
MRISLGQIFLYAILCSVFLLPSCQQNEVDLEHLLDNMVDQDRIARLPEIPFELKQFSSYDRGSKAADEPGWYANSDRTMFLREETSNGRKEYVMMDTDGPGAVVRIWMTFAGQNSGKGILRFYFDNDTVPAIEGVALDIISGGQLVGEPLSSSVSELSSYDKRGHNLYLPIPYAKHCKITYETDNVKDYGNKTNKGESVYYNINYRTYPANISVSTFSLKELESLRNKITSIQKQLMSREMELSKNHMNKTAHDDILSSGEQWSTKFNGSSVIRYLSVKLVAENLPQALRTTILELEFDGERTAWCPIGDFFGTGYQLRKVDTWYTKVNENGLMESNWIMPFSDSARIIINNIGDQEIKFETEIYTDDWKWDDKSLHFGASWHQFSNIFTREGLSDTESGSPFDLNYVELEGKGNYVGDVLVLFNTSYIWWGEGDEKIYVDRESFPSHFGTGTEDYYGYAWGGVSFRFSNHPFIAQPDETGNAKPGYVVNLRYRNLDIIPFNEHLKVDMELWHWHPTWMNYAPATFFYLRPGGKTNIEPDEEGALTKVAIESTDIIPNDLREGSIEAERMAFRNSCGNKKGSMGINTFGNIELSNNLQVFWNDGVTGDSIIFRFTSPDQGKHKVSAVFTSGPAFGEFKASLNGKMAGKQIDLSGEGRLLRKVELGTFEIQRGENTLVFILAPSKGNSNLFGIDKLLIE